MIENTIFNVVAEEFQTANVHKKGHCQCTVSGPIWWAVSGPISVHIQKRQLGRKVRIKMLTFCPLKTKRKPYAPLVWLKNKTSQKMGQKLCIKNFQQMGQKLTSQRIHIYIYTHRCVCRVDKWSTFAPFTKTATSSPSTRSRRFPFFQRKVQNTILIPKFWGLQKIEPNVDHLLTLVWTSY